MMPDSPHTSTPMVMQGRSLALKNTCQNASSTSVEKHLSWSPDIHPTARWVPSTPHRSRPAGRPPNRQPCAAGAEEREYDGGCDVEADGKRRRRRAAAKMSPRIRTGPEADSPAPPAQKAPLLGAAGCAHDPAGGREAVGCSIHVDWGPGHPPQGDMCHSVAGAEGI